MDNMKKAYQEYNSQILKYGNKNNFKNTTSKEVINFIHNNIENINKNEISDEILIKEIISKIFSDEKIEKECLIFDLLNYSSNEKINTIDDAIKMCIEILKKYQYKAGGFNIEDINWIIADQKNNHFKVKDGQKIIYNSIYKKYCDKELIWFLDSILKYIKRHINCEKIIIKYNLFEDNKNCICWIIFKFFLKN
jgi:hypothetical protein